jgi:hypothetical protein
MPVETLNNENDKINSEWKMPTDKELKKSDSEIIENISSHKILGAGEKIQNKINNINALFEKGVFPKVDEKTKQELKYLYFDKITNPKSNLPEYSDVQKSINKNIDRYASCIEIFQSIQKYQQKMPDYIVSENPYKNADELFKDFKKYEDPNIDKTEKEAIEDKFKHLKQAEEIFKIAEESRKSNLETIGSQKEVQEDLKKAA